MRYIFHVKFNTLSCDPVTSDFLIAESKPLCYEQSCFDMWDVFPAESHP